MEGRRNRISHVLAWLERPTQDEGIHPDGGKDQSAAGRTEADRVVLHEESETKH
jgi:hypothetical protein